MLHVENVVGLYVPMGYLILDMHMVEALDQIPYDLSQLCRAELLGFQSFFQDDISQGFIGQFLLNDHQLRTFVLYETIHLQKSSEEGS